MIENRPWLTYLAHGILILGILLVSFPIYIALVASTHLPEDLIGTVQAWFGGELLNNYRTVLLSGKESIPLGVAPGLMHVVEPQSAKRLN